MRKCAFILAVGGVLAGLVPARSAELAAHPIKAALSLEMQAAGGRLVLEADQFQQVGSSDPSGSGAKTFLPTRFRVRITGRQQGTSIITGSRGTADDWVSRCEVNTVFDEEIEGLLPPSTSLDWAAALRDAPMRVVVGSGKQPLIELSLTLEKGLSEAGGAWALKWRNGSTRTELTRTQESRDGQRVEKVGAPQSQPFAPRIEILLGAGREGKRMRHDRLRGPEFVFGDEDLREVNVVTPERLVAQGEASAVSQANSLPGLLGGFPDGSVRLKWQFAVGHAPDVGWFEAASSGGKPWWPELGGSRDVRIKLSRPDRVKAVEVYLAEVSALPGVAFNAVEAVATRSEGWNGRRREVPVEFREGETALRWGRLQVDPPSREVDLAPDLALRVEDHSGASNSQEPGRAGRLVFQQIKPELMVRVRSADWAARGRLGVRVQVDGIWDDLPVKGAGADADRQQLVLPEGSDGDGVPDGFGTDSEDDGDGLSLAQEYRGVIVGGKHRRLSPELREVFLSDPGGCLTPDHRLALGHRFSALRVELIFLEEGETLMPGVPVIALERMADHFLPQVMRLEDPIAQRNAFRAIRPRPGCGTVFVGPQVDPQLVAGDLARVLNLDELGSQP